MPLAGPLTAGPNGTAKQASILGQQARIRNRQARADLIRLGKQAFAQEPLILAAINRQLSLLKEQIAQTRSILNDTSVCYCEACDRGGIDGKERAGLLRALNELLKHECRLLNIGEPARVRPVNQPGPMRHAVLPEPIPAPALPEPQANTSPDATTSSTKPA